MLFDPNDPFPLIETNTLNYPAAKIHSEKVDQFLGFEFAVIEKKLQAAEADETQETWKHIDPQSFQTPYSELRWMLHLLNPQAWQTVVDLGSAYGRMAFVIGRHYPQVYFKGFELVGERVLESQRVLAKWNYPLCYLYQRDLLQEIPPPADIYFIYDFGKQSVISKTLQDLRDLSKVQKFSVVARGRGTRALIHAEHPWLCEVQEPLHTEHFSIYRS